MEGYILLYYRPNFTFFSFLERFLVHAYDQLQLCSIYCELYLAASGAQRHKKAKRTIYMRGDGACGGFVEFMLLACCAVWWGLKWLWHLCAVWDVNTATLVSARHAHGHHARVGLSDLHAHQALVLYPCGLVWWSLTNWNPKWQHDQHSNLFLGTGRKKSTDILVCSGRHRTCCVLSGIVNNGRDGDTVRSLSVGFVWCKMWW